jgi:hypothetical protein
VWVHQRASIEAARVRKNYSQLAKDPAVQEECGCDSLSSSAPPGPPVLQSPPSGPICGFWGCVDTGGNR